MADTDFTRAIRDFLAGEFPRQAAAIARVPVDGPLEELGILDSMGLLTLAAFIEARWNVKVPPKTYKEAFSSLQRAGETIEALRRRP